MRYKPSSNLPDDGKIARKGSTPWERKKALGVAKASPKKKAMAQKMRRNMTETEAILWDCLRQRRLLGYFFSRQRIIRGYIADFYCAELKVVIEVDGGYHTTAEQQQYDKHRDGVFRSCGIETIRVTDKDVKYKLADTIRKLKIKLKQIRKYRALNAVKDELKRLAEQREYPVKPEVFDDHIKRSRDAWAKANPNIGTQYDRREGTAKRNQSKRGISGRRPQQ